MVNRGPPGSGPRPARAGLRRRCRARPRAAADWYAPLPPPGAPPLPSPLQALDGRSPMRRAHSLLTYA
ncbi:hypothetical protein D7X12_01500 [Corallococcus sicarius]|uniref:Uncharacterized protein n=1 Tax=Corallococcus sicarius TaxID=2316726 RepID=A0A3A8P3F8_9BACT|nr:hypothetical protein D7X12_01500 [Corallococcus sicarius]